MSKKNKGIYWLSEGAGERRDAGRRILPFLSVHACFLVFYGLPHVFINTMLLGQTGDVKVVVMYNATFFPGQRGGHAAGGRAFCSARIPA